MQRVLLTKARILLLRRRLLLRLRLLEEPMQRAWLLRRRYGRLLIHPGGVVGRVSHGQVRWRRRSTAGLVRSSGRRLVRHHAQRTRGLPAEPRVLLLERLLVPLLGLQLQVVLLLLLLLHLLLLLQLLQLRSLLLVESLLLLLLLLLALPLLLLLLCMQGELRLLLLLLVVHVLESGLQSLRCGLSECGSLLVHCELMVLLLLGRLMPERGLRGRHAAHARLTVQEARHAAGAPGLRCLPAPRPTAARRMSLLKERQQVVRALRLKWTNFPMSANTSITCSTRCRVSTWHP